VSGDTYRLVFEKSAEEQLAAMGTKLRAAILASLECLETDPYINVGGVNWKSSKAFGSLRKLGIDVRIFKAFEIQRWRVFFIVDEIAKAVVVKEVVRRRTDSETYDDIKQPHVQRLIDNYNRWLQRRRQ
jgi:mRNA-degrading endonuclease RelE of RelBE toxin-antitoxin system